MLVSLLVMSTVAPVTSSEDVSNFTTAGETNRLLSRQLNPHAALKVISGLRGTQEVCEAIEFGIEDAAEIYAEFNKEVDPVLSSVGNSGDITVDFSKNGAYTKLLSSKCADKNGDMYLVTFSFDCFMTIFSGGSNNLFAFDDDTVFDNDIVFDDDTVGEPLDFLSRTTLKKLPMCMSNCPDAEVIEDEFEKLATATGATCGDSIDIENSGTMLSVRNSLVVMSIVSSMASMLLM